MTIELSFVLWSAVLLVVYVIVQAGISNSAYGTDFTLTPRDTPPAPSPRAERASRAIRNLLETYPAFLAAMLVANAATPGDPVVFWGAAAWLVARIVYLPLYIFGVVGLRSLVWIVSLLGLIAIFVGILV